MRIDKVVTERIAGRNNGIPKIQTVEINCWLKLDLESADRVRQNPDEIKLVISDEQYSWIKATNRDMSGDRTELTLYLDTKSLLKMLRKSSSDIKRWEDHLNI